MTGWNALIDNLDSLPDYFLEAFQRFSTGRPRPVELEVPTDLFEKQTDIEVPAAARHSRDSTGPVQD